MKNPEAVLATVEEEKIVKNAGFMQIMDGLRTCLAGVVLALQVGGVRGETVAQHGEAPFGSTWWAAMLLGALLPLVGYLAAVWRQRRPATVSRGVMCCLKETSAEELSRLTVEALREELRQFGAKVSGTKEECME